MRAACTLLCGVCLLGAAANGGEDEAAEPDSGQPSAAAATLDVADILAKPLTDDDYRETKNCLNIRDIDDVEVLDDTVVLFHGRRRELWLNQLSSQCLGLASDMVINLRSFGGTVCRLDRFRGRYRFEPLVAITAECRLGTFETIDGLQAEALRAAVVERREVEDMARKTRKSARSDSDEE